MSVCVRVFCIRVCGRFCANARFRTSATHRDLGSGELEHKGYDPTCACYPSAGAAWKLHWHRRVMSLFSTSTMAEGVIFSLGSSLTRLHVTCTCNCSCSCSCFFRKQCMCEFKCSRSRRGDRCRERERERVIKPFLAPTRFDSVLSRRDCVWCGLLVTTSRSEGLQVITHSRGFCDAPPWWCVVWRL